MRRIASTAVFAIATALALAGCRPVGDAGARDRGGPPKILLIALDGADWEILDRLEKEGRLPNLARLRREGAWGVLDSEPPYLSPIVWTTIATGRSPLDHGILGFLTARDGVTEPVRSDERLVRSFWNIAGEHGASVGVVGWYASWPAEKVNGFLVTDRVGSHQIAGSAGRAATGLAYPEDLVPQIEALRGAVERDLGESAMERYVDGGAPAVAALRKETRETFLGILRTTELYRRLVPVVLRRFAPEIAAVYFEGTDAVGHLFVDYQPPRLPWVSEDDVARYGAAWDRYYESVDVVIGELVAEADPARTTVMIVSDHGFRVGARRPRAPVDSVYGNQAPLAHRGEGILLLWGRGVRAGTILPHAQVYDVLPTIFRFAGLPLAEKLRGRPIDAAMTAEVLGRPVKTVADYESDGDRVKAVPGELDSDETMAKLRALGYVGGAAASSLTAGKTGQAAIPLNRYNASLVLLNDGKRSAALQIYAELQRDHPEFPLGWLGEGLVLIQDQKGAQAIAPLERAASLLPGLSAPHAYLGDAYLQAGRIADARRALERSLELDASQGRTALLLGQIYVTERRLEPAARLFDAAWRLADSSTDRARACVGLAVLAEEERRFDAAERQYEEALRLVPDLASALERFANLRLYQKRPADAVVLLERLVARSGESPVSLLLYGRALAMAGRPAEARSVLERAVAKDPKLAEARRLLHDLPKGS